MNKQEFKRLYRGVRIDVRNATEESGARSNGIDRVSIVIGFHGAIRSAGASWFGRDNWNAKMAARLCSSLKWIDDAHDRRRNVVASRSEPAVRIPQ